MSPPVTSDAERVRRRFERLVRAGINIFSQHDLPGVLQEVADSARAVTGAQYAALGLLNERRDALAQFVTSGLTSEERDRIGALPEGHGILGILITDPRPRRISDIARHPKSHGTPPNHPEMHSFLGVPVLGRSGPIGNLYVTNKEGAAEFDAEDEAVAVMLAAQAAVAVESASLYEERGRLLNEMQEVRRTRDRFFAMINHELRNALTATYGWAELLIRKDPEKLPRAAFEVFETSERTLALLNDLLDLSRLEVAKLEPVPQTVDVARVARDAVRAVEPSGIKRDVPVTLDSTGQPIPARTDPKRVRQILINVLTNAVRHSPSGTEVGVAVTVEGDAIRFDIQDRGEGIPPDRLQSIFDAFDRGGASRGPGVGLGLALSRRLSRALGGDLTVESTPGRGACFTLRISRYLEPNEM